MVHQQKQNNFLPQLGNPWDVVRWNEPASPALSDSPRPAGPQTANRQSVNTANAHLDNNFQYCQRQTLYRPFFLYLNLNMKAAPAPPKIKTEKIIRGLQTLKKSH